jgi:hypothetical protein
MILFPHMLVGATIGYRVKNYWAIFVIAIFLHFLFDRIPHWEYTAKLKIQNVSIRELSFLLFKALIDLAVGTLIIWVFLRDSAYLSYILLGAFTSILPDGIVFLHFLMRGVFNRELPILKRFYDFHENIHIQDDKNYAIWGLATQSLIIFLSIYLILGGP